MNVTNVLKEFTDTLLFEYDCDSARLEFTPAAPAVLGLPDLLPLRGDAGGRGLTEAADKLRRLLRAARPGGPVIKAEVAFLGQDGQIWVYLFRCKALKGVRGAGGRIVGKLTDITERFDREQDLLRRASMDVLTGVYNRSAEEMISRRLKEVGGGVLFMIDLDDFKQINDTLGHSVGDQVLVAVSDVLKHLFRAGDIVARVGGDEFVVFLESPLDPDLMARRAQMILTHLERISLPQLNGPVKASIGVALSPPVQPDYAALHLAADQAMYESKRTQKNSFRLHVPAEMQTQNT